MTKPIVLSESPIAMCELKEELEKIKARDSELNFRAAKTQEYLEQFVELPAKKLHELKKKIEDLNVLRLKSEHIAKIVDLLPTTVEELKVILQSYTVSVTNENLNKIVEAVNEVVPAKK